MIPVLPEFLISGVQRILTWVHLPEGKRCTNKCLMCVHRIQFSRNCSLEHHRATDEGSPADYLAIVDSHQSSTRFPPCADSVTSTAVYQTINPMSSGLSPPQHPVDRPAQPPNQFPVTREPRVYHTGWLLSSALLSTQSTTRSAWPNPSVPVSEDRECTTPLRVCQAFRLTALPQTQRVT